MRKLRIKKRPIGPHIADITNLTRTELRKKYKSTYSSWSNGKSRAKSEDHANWSEEFDDFRDFLRIMGPRPSADHTLDRIDNNDKSYGPDKVRWANKREQANNRSDTRFVMKNGSLRASADVAREDGVLPNTYLRRQHRAGSAMFTADPRKFRPWPPKLADQLERLYLANGAPAGGNRFQFFIRMVEARIQDEAPFFRDNHPEDDDDALAAERARRGSELDRLNMLLRSTRALYASWRFEVRVFEGGLAEKRRLREGDYLNRRRLDSQYE